MSGEVPGGPARELARLLARRLRERGAPADEPMTVAELRRELLPYPRCREAAGLASKAEYDLAVLDLLAAPAVLRPEDPELADAVAEERAAPEPGLGFLEGFAASTLRPGPALVGTAEGRAPDPAPAPDPEPASAPDPEPASAPDPAPDPDPAPAPDPASAPEPDPPPDPAPEPPGCPSCGGELPDRGGLRFCPWCGDDLAAPRCGGCGEELDPDWSFCPVCGAEAPGRAG